MRAGSGGAITIGIRPVKRSLTGWARTSPSVAEVASPTTVHGLATGIDHAPPRGVIARGLGRSYGDAAQNAGGLVVDATRVTGIQQVDMEAGIVSVSAGTSIEDLMRWAVPRGWFVPVTPGTRFVTVGGAIASDIHGKNHHRDGSWCEHVRSLTLRTPAGETLEVRPERSSD